MRCWCPPYGSVCPWPMPLACHWGSEVSEVSESRDSSPSPVGLFRLRCMVWIRGVVCFPEPMAYVQKVEECQGLSFDFKLLRLNLFTVRGTSVAPWSAPVDRTTRLLGVQRWREWRRVRGSDWQWRKPGGRATVCEDEDWQPTNSREVEG